MPLDLQANLANLAQMVRKAQVESVDHPGRLVLRAHRVLQEILVVMVLQANLVILGQRDRRARQALQVNLVLRVRLESQAYLN